MPQYFSLFFQNTLVPKNFKNIYIHVDLAMEPTFFFMVKGIEEKLKLSKSLGVICCVPRGFELYSKLMNF